MGPILKHQQNHVSCHSNLMTTVENETFTGIQTVYTGIHTTLSGHFSSRGVTVLGIYI